MNLHDLTGDMNSGGEKALVPFLTAGYPDEQTFLELLRAAAKAGCRIIEIGIPFSDPIADGPVIQASSEQALANGITLDRVLALTAEAVRSTSAGFVLMGYVNPVLRMGVEIFADRAREAGALGAIIPDVPAEESGRIRQTFCERGLAFVDLVALTSSRERIAAITESAEGFVYLVALKGVTGARASTANNIANNTANNLGAFVSRVRDKTDLPLYTGFGIADRDGAVRAVRHADGVIIGSALIRIIQSARTKKEAVSQVGGFLEDIHQAINPVERNQKR
jgi:tryptophan synthase alpha chain